ncbi:putative lipid-transfer protein DIR1 [Asparagus officinalis]|uniref:putative lipid-transfer protein DIR1 n=1 Tax=Asparagus officinalis TaxID=4686 RepID=UPI00098E6D42|nr:putative lipid-transfer protein DIR1 [Asparagus officinalis]XP_020271444.1 putative lipid-transfer protein DIR1 [Asparagus officinalis]
MKSGSASICLLILTWALILGLLGHPATAQSPCSTSFFSVLVQLMPCRPAVAQFSTVPPSEVCCNAVRSLGQDCLCALLNGPPITGVDRDSALQLPNKCNVNSVQLSNRLLYSRMLPSIDSKLRAKELTSSEIREAAALDQRRSKLL